MASSIKRNDIQWLRAVAIFVVICFHTWPHIFFHGYLGVDIVNQVVYFTNLSFFSFFVISGYLMSFIMGNNPNMGLLLFYLRRLKRIFPIFLLIIFCSVIIGLFVLLPSFFSFLQTDALWSIFFVNNFSTMLNQKKYFELVSDFKFFLHTWSLGVEIQFYLMAPFLLNFILTKSKPLIFAGIIALASAFLQLFVPNESVAFGLVFCRLWQFLVGTISYLLLQMCDTKMKQNNEEEEALLLLENNDKKMHIKEFCFWNKTISKAALVILAAICLLPFDFIIISFVLKPIQRLSVTLLTGIFIVFNTNDPLILPYGIEKVLVYFGNASYSFYLVHWPVIIYFKYFNIFGYYGNLFTLLCICFLSLFFHECFEKPMGKLSSKINLIFIGLCYMAILYLCTGGENQLLSILKRPMTSKEIANAIKLNEAEAISCNAETFFLKECKTDPIIEKYLRKKPKSENLDIYCSYSLNPNSTKTIMITGNSYIWFQIYGISEAIKRARTQFSKVYIISHPGCSLIIGELNNNIKQWDCENYDGSHNELIEMIKPDVIVHSSRFEHFFANETSPYEIVKYNETNISQAVLNAAKLTKKLIIIQPPPRFLNGGPLAVAHLLFTNQRLDKFDISVQEYQKRTNFSWEILMKAIKSCTNCLTISTEKIFCDKKICPYLETDRKVARYCDTVHTTPNESLKLIPDLIKAYDMAK